MMLKSSSEPSESEGEEGNVQRMGMKELGPQMMTQKSALREGVCLPQLHIPKVKSPGKIKVIL